MIMINPEEYEGHTEGKREIRHGVFIDIEGRGLHATVAGGFTRADVKLMADAPKLLSKVKRQNKQIALAYEWVMFKFGKAGFEDFSKYIGDMEDES